MAEHCMKHGTLLQTISGQGIYIECRECGHTSTLKVADAYADLSIESTARHSSELGYHNTVLSDCCGATSDGGHHGRDTS